MGRIISNGKKMEVVKGARYDCGRLKIPEIAEGIIKINW
jgi:hypothetical protein